MKKIRRTSIEVTDACNLFCAACKTPHGKNFISVEKFTRIVEKLGGHITRLGLHWRGEPLLHPKLPRLARIAKEHDFKLWLSTNTSVPNLSKSTYMRRLLENLEWIEFCVDGYDENTIGKYRVGANWELITRNLQTISEVETECIKKMRVLMFKYNDGKEDVYRHIAKKYNMDELIFARPLIGLGKTISTDMAAEWLSTNEKYQRYHEEEGRWHLMTGRCNATPIISVHGVIYPCCLDWELAHPLGDLTTETWINIMNRYRKLHPWLGIQRMCELCCISSQQVNFMEKII
jgi:MoaA/NifB/PqqE/SkfB family radical SAM enzyme